MARIAGINIPQNKNVHIGLTYIYGIGSKFSQQICNNLSIPSKKRIHELTEDEIGRVKQREADAHDDEQEVDMPESLHQRHSS